MEKYTDIHVSLPKGMLAELDRIARLRGMRRAHLLREAVATFLERVKKELIEKEIKSYVEDFSSHSGDFVRETDAHTIERLLRETEW